MTKPVEHGTYEGYQWHTRNHNPYCDPCRKAASLYHYLLRHRQEWQRRADAFIKLGVAQ